MKHFAIIAAIIAVATPRWAEAAPPKGDPEPGARSTLNLAVPD